MISIAIIVAIIISIMLGYKTKINTGFFAMGFAYIIGCFILGLKPAAVVGMWPTKIFFVIFAVSLFYNFAMANGTLEKLAQHMIYHTRKVPQLLPFAIFLGAAFVAALGAGYFTVLAFFAPITLILCEKTGLNKLFGAMVVNYGSLAGANFMTSASGLIFKGLMEGSNYGEQANGYTTEIFLVTFILPIVILTIASIFKKKNKGSVEVFDVQPAEPFDNVQKTTLTLIFTMVLIALIFPILRSLIPGNEMIKFINSKIDIGLLAILFSIIALMLKLGKEKEVISRVPWNTIIMICGVGMLIQVAIKAGTIALLSGWLGSSIPAPVLPIVLCLISGIMSFFSSTLGVVAPTLFPIVRDLSAASGIAPSVLFVAIIVGAQSTSISPFSSGGSLILGTVSEEKKDELFNSLLVKGAPICLSAAIVVSVILSFVS